MHSKFSGIVIADAKARIESEGKDAIRNALLRLCAVLCETQIEKWNDRTAILILLKVLLEDNTDAVDNEVRRAVEKVVATGKPLNDGPLAYVIGRIESGLASPEQGQ